MPIKIRLGDGIVVEAESEEELRTVFSALGYKDGALGQAGVKDERLLESVEKRLRRVYGRLRSYPQRRTLQVLAQSPEGLRDYQLRTNLNFASNNQLAGVMAGLSKHARKLDLKIGHILVKQTVPGPDRRNYLYRLTPEMRDVANEQPWGEDGS